MEGKITRAVATRSLPFIEEGEVVSVEEPYNKYSPWYVVLDERRICWHKYWDHIWDWFEPFPRESFSDCRGGIIACKENSEKEHITLYEHLAKYHPALFNV